MPHAQQPRKRARDTEDDMLGDEVSDGASSCSGDSNDVDELLSINGTDEEAENENEVILANRQCNESVDALLTREYGPEPPRETLPPVSAKLVEVINRWMRCPPKREDIKAMFQHALLPENVDSLLPVKINEILYHRLPFRAKLNDQKLRGINTYFSQGVAPLLCAMDSLVKMETKLSNIQDPPQLTIQNQIVRVDGEQLDIKQLRLWLGQALKIFSTGNSVVLLKRKVNLRGFLDSKFHHLLKPTNPVTQELLGPDLEQKILDGTRASEVGKKIASFSRKSHWSGNNFRMSRDREQGR